VEKELREKTNWTDSDDLDLMFRGTYAPGFYRALYRMVHSDFRLRRELSRFPRPESVARSVKHLAGFLSARIAVESRSRRRNPALP
jgi:hypothetical protein